MLSKHHGYDRYDKMAAHARHDTRVAFRDAATLGKGWNVCGPCERGDPNEVVAQILEGRTHDPKRGPEHRDKTNVIPFRRRFEHGR